MRQFFTIASNAFMELIRQPIFLLLMTASASFIIFLSSVTYFGFGEDPTMVKQSALAVMLISGLFCAVLCASASVAQEVRSGTALAVLSKPVSRAGFLIAKFVGVAAALAVLTYTNLLACLCSSKMAFDVYGEADRKGVALFFGCVLVAYLFGGFINFFLRRPFVSQGVLGLAVMITVAFVVLALFNKDWESQPFGKGMDWRMIPAGILILLALWLLAGLAVACTTRWDLIPTLALCSALFLVGLMSDYFFSERAQAGSWWASVLYTLIPNWQLFWLANALEPNKSIPWIYVGKVCAYVIAYLGAVLALALVLFEDRELS